MSLLFPKQIDFYALPIFASSQQAITGGLAVGTLFRTLDGSIKVVGKISNLTCDFSSGYSYLARAF